MIVHALKIDAVVIKKMVNTICHDLLPDIIGYVSIDDLRYLRNVSSVIDRIMRYLKKCVFFGLNGVTYDLSKVKSSIIKLSSGKCIGFIEHVENDVLTNVEVYSVCYCTRINVFLDNVTIGHLCYKVDVDRNIMMNRYGSTYTFMPYDGTIESLDTQYINIYNKLHWIRLQYIDFNTCYVTGSSDRGDQYYESFVVLYKDGSWQ